ncbi:MAG TPA: aldehyde dehydrogenase family protein [Microbacterium sp.]|uniref:aldehyde dehydrogenase family protein n=1 Tax=Microbacterium sp. TaxID=51671 RepID=UPI002CA17EF3|nr:aldehyde dehydrogenase family protein [Microbacterium sp.]HWI30547.1 aldehyde dehydrogenase family protein [Microbacterium sp.]
MSTIETTPEQQSMLTPLAAAAAVREGFRSGITRPLEWRREQLIALDRMIAENAEEFERAVRDDLGKPGLEAFLTEVAAVRMEVAQTLELIGTWTAEREVESPPAALPATASIHREPLGTVLVIAPWNYPVHLLFLPAIAAIAAGNAVVLKPSEVVPATSALVARLVPGYLDPRAIRVVEGAVAETTELLEFPWDHIFYTGNGAVGRIVMAAAAKHLTPVTLELGGKSPVWVDDSADLDATAKWLAWGKFLNAGQTCVAPDYVLTTADVRPRLVEALRREITAMYGTDPRTSADFGRIVNERHLNRLVGLLPESGVSIGGEWEAADLYIAPTVLEDVTLQDPVMGEEIFGPILPILTVGGPDEAIGIINDRDKPLALYAFTNSAATQRAFLERTSSGSLVVNAVILQLAVHELPFGGVGASGMGAYHGEHGIRTFSHDKAFLVKHDGPDLMAISRPPFTPEKEQMLRGASA